MQTATAAANVDKIGTAVRVANSPGGVPTYLVTVENETRLVSFVSDLEWSGAISKESGALVAREVWRLGFPTRILVSLPVLTWKA